MADVILWVPVLTALAGISGALGSQYVSHLLTRKREERAATSKLESERLFIATELVFLLEQFAEACAGVATDHGYLNQNRITVPETTVPSLSYAVVTGDWRVLSAKLMYRIRELPVIQIEADRAIDAAEAYPPDYDEFFSVRQYQYIRLGLKAIIQARRLRQFAGLPNTRLDVSSWSAQNVLWKEWRLERTRRSVQATLRQQAFAQLNVALQHSIANNNQRGETQ